MIKSYLVVLSIAFLMHVSAIPADYDERVEYMELLNEKEMCTSHIYCKSKCCLEPRQRKRRFGRKGGKDGGRGRLL